MITLDRRNDPLMEDKASLVAAIQNLTLITRSLCRVADHLVGEAERQMLEAVQDDLDLIMKTLPPKTHSMDKIMRKVADTTGHKISALMSKSKDQGVVFAQQMFMYAAAMRGFTDEEIGAYIVKDKVVVSAGINKVIKVIADADMGSVMTPFARRHVNLIAQVTE